MPRSSPGSSERPSTTRSQTPSASVAEVRAYLAKLAVMIAIGVGAMTLAAVTAWKLYGPTEPERLERAPVPARGAAMPAPPAYSR